MVDLIGLAEMAMSTKAKSVVSRKKKEGECLVCNHQAERGYRGLCRVHYFQFSYARRKQSGRIARKSFEMEQIQKGRLLPSIRGRHSKRNIFLEG